MGGAVELMRGLQGTGRETHRDRKQISGCQGLREWGLGRDCLMGTGFPLG